VVNRKKIIIVIALIVSLISLYLGHFLFNWQSRKKIVDTMNNESGKSSIDLPVKYSHISTLINNNRQEIDVLEIDLSTGKAEISPLLSHGRMFGFEELSKIISRSNAYAAINAGFFYEYGDPSGMVVADGRLITKSSGKYPVFTIKGCKAEITQIYNEIYMIHNGARIDLTDINRIGKAGNVVLYTPDFGIDNRAATSNTSVIILNNKVIGINKNSAPTVIPKGGAVLTFFEPYKYDFAALPIKENDSINFVCEPEISPDMQAYECGSWIVKDGKSVAPKRDDWVGLLTNRDPRTVVGIKSDGVVVLMTVDGRQPGYSIGVSSKELAGFLIDYGIRDAAMLDGGASTEMIVQGRIVNKPSNNGKERPLGGALVVRIKE